MARTDGVARADKNSFLVCRVTTEVEVIQNIGEANVKGTYDHFITILGCIFPHLTGFNPIIVLKYSYLRKRSEVYLLSAML